MRISNGVLVTTLTNKNSFLLNVGSLLTCTQYLQNEKNMMETIFNEIGCDGAYFCKTQRSGIKCLLTFLSKIPFSSIVFALKKDSKANSLAPQDFMYRLQNRGLV